ncbi:41235_t:CDS:2 [Gigaspora margarita]|uniref:41235_t:CDS:1 n=1 Tax=Gigaspora margarita TaxID=4874 RepID=A0ABN7UNF3_GIGMA|nr:41235_t:CDS:2 [Gigaspora margarita]
MSNLTNDNRISEIQQGIDFEKDKLKEYYELIKLSNKIHEDILVLQEDINNLENDLLRKKFGDYDKIIKT